MARALTSTLAQICGEQLPAAARSSAYNDPDVASLRNVFERTASYVPEPFIKENVKPIVWNLGQVSFKGPNGERRRLLVPMPEQTQASDIRRTTSGSSSLSSSAPTGWFMPEKRRSRDLGRPTSSASSVRSAAATSFIPEISTEITS